MRDRVLFFWGHLRGRPGLAFWLKERVIAKAVVPARLAQEAAFPAALGHVLGAIGSHERADGDKGGGAALIDQIAVAPGYERALGAALGDDLRLPVADSGAGWRALPPDASPETPPGTQPLAPHVSAPPALARRLNRIFLAPDAATAAALQPALAPGDRLVTPAGDLIRWDGLALPAGEAASAAALHLEQVNRLSAITETFTVWMAFSRFGLAMAVMWWKIVK